jgi:hypothetical protein
MWIYQIIASNTCPNIDAELLLVFRLDYIMRIFLCPQVTVVKIDDATTIKTCLICKEYRRNKGRVNTLLNKPGL